MQILGFLAPVMGTVMRWIYQLIGNYGFTIIIFTVLVRLLMVPLSIKQQKSTAKMAAYNPMIQEIQKKWANDKQRQQQEVMKFQEENGIKMTEGCLPMVLNMVIMFSIIVAIYAPMKNILQIPQQQVDNGIVIAKHYTENEDDKKKFDASYTQESLLIGEIINTDAQRFIDGVDVEVTDDEGGTTTAHYAMEPESIEKVQNFKFEFFGLNLARVPSFSEINNWENFKYLILPILSILTMVASMFVSTKLSGQSSQGQGRGSMWIMTIFMGVFFGYYAFTVPVGFSLYYAASNVVMAVQQAITSRIYNAEKYKEQILAEMEERKNAKKAKKQITVKDDSGAVVTKEMSDAEIAKLRLAMARQQDTEKYSADDDDEAALEKARRQDEARYGAKANAEAVLLEEVILDDDELDEEEKAVLESEIADTAQAIETPAAEQYKPGRRRRARQSKQEESSFAQQEKEAENKKSREEV